MWCPRAEARCGRPAAKRNEHSTISCRRSDSRTKPTRESLDARWRFILILTFRHDLTAAAARLFEKEYEPPLRFDDEDKDFILSKGLAVWLCVDGALAGEAYGATVEDLLSDGDISDFESSDVDWLRDVQKYPSSVYCCSTTILTRFQGRGLGKILKAYWLGYVWGKYPGRTITGHATSPAMVKINEAFGATLLGSHRKWFATGRVAYFYEIVPSSSHPTGG